MQELPKSIVGPVVWCMASSLGLGTRLGYFSMGFSGHHATSSYKRQLCYLTTQFDWSVDGILAIR